MAWTMTKKRVGEPFMPADEYGRSLPAFTLNLLVADIARSVAFYRDVLGSEVRYADADFAAPRLGGRGRGAGRGLFGVAPDAAVLRAREAGAAVLLPATDKPHGWREAWLEDPDGYVWAVGVAIGG